MYWLKPKLMNNNLNLFAPETENLTSFQPAQNFKDVVDPCLTPCARPISTGSSKILMPRIQFPGSKTIQVVDIAGNPLVGVHIQRTGIAPSSGTITNQNGYAILDGIGPEEQVVISHVGKRTIQRKFKDLGSLITMNDEVMTNTDVDLGTVTTPRPEDKKGSGVPWKTIFIGVGLLWGASYMFSQSGSSSSKGKRKKKKAQAV